MKRISVMIAMLLIIAGCGANNNSSNEKNGNDNEYDPVDIKLAINLPDDHYVSKGVDKFVDNVEERSGGNVDIEVYPNGELLSDKDMNDAVLNGNVEMGVNSSTLWASTIPAMGIFDVPFTFEDYSETQNLLDGEFGDILKDEAEEKGAEVLMFQDYGYVQIASNNKQVETLDDFEGMKIRSYGDLNGELLKTFGASPSFLGADEVYTGLQRDTIDGATSGTTAMLQRNYFEVADYLSISDYSSVEFLLMANKEFMDGLPDATKDLLMEESRDAEDWIRDQAEEEDVNSAEKLEDEGMEVYEVPDDEVEKWKDASAPVRDVYIEDAGDIGEKLLDLADKE